MADGYDLPADTTNPPAPRRPPAPAPAWPDPAARRALYRHRATLAAVAGTIDYAVVGYLAGGTPPGPSGGFTLGVTGTGCTLLPVDLQSFSVDR